HSMDAKPLNFIRPEVPAELAAVVAKMLAKEPERRFQTPVEVAQALTPFFKRANAAFKSPQADVLQADQSNAARPLVGVVTTPTQPAIDAGNVDVRASKAAMPTVPERRWESLIDIRETDSS